MLIFLDKKGLVHWLQLAYNSYEVFQAYQFEEGVLVEGTNPLLSEDY